ncbi:MAG: hypothetical protein QM426_04250 [Euryarchaeota archaeon]|nr:hypothetical protein [Euryarchaeota archaeon]
MWIGIVVVVLVAIISFWFASNISKGRINLIHSYHTKNIKNEDIMNYAKLFSKGLYVIGIGCLIAGFFIYNEIGIGVLLSIFSGIIIGLLFIHKAQKKYNRGWFH